MPYQPHGRFFFGGSHPQAEGSSICKLGLLKKLLKPPHSLLTNDSNAIEMALKWPNPWPNPNFWNPPPKALSRVTVTFSPQCFLVLKVPSQPWELTLLQCPFEWLGEETDGRMLETNFQLAISHWKIISFGTYQQVNGNRITSIHLECQGVLASMTTKFCPAFVTT